MWYPHHEFGWDTILFGSLMMVLFWGALIGLIVWLFRATIGPGSRGRHDAEGANYYQPSRDALEILKERYARGEISRAEYEQIRDDLRE